MSDENNKIAATQVLVDSSESSLTEINNNILNQDSKNDQSLLSSVIIEQTNNVTSGSIKTKKSSWKRNPKLQESSNDTVDDQSITTKFTNITQNSMDTRQTLSISGKEILRDTNRGILAEEAFPTILNYFQTASIPVPNSSTVVAPHAQADLLYELEKVTQQIVQLISLHQKDCVEGTPIIFSDYNRTLTLLRLVSMAELQRHKKHFVKSNGQLPPSNAVLIGTAFLDYLASQI
jgi:tRNA uridine 5-carbamoylmethylation protein Kti12